jgi:uncharacterized DUF497 family protein
MAENAGLTYHFDWDPAKAIDNVRKHNVTFEQAATIFLDPLALTVYDEAHSQNEERWFTLGHDVNEALLAVAHTYQSTGPTSFGIRIISARKATPRESRFYQDEPR